MSAIYAYLASHMYLVFGGVLVLLFSIIELLIYLYPGSPDGPTNPNGDWL